MAISSSVMTPGLEAFRQSVQNDTLDADTLIEILISLFQRRQITGPKASAEATALLLRRLVESFLGSDLTGLLSEVQHVGHRLCSAQPRELAAGNMVRRVLGLIRGEMETPSLMQDSTLQTQTINGRKSELIESQLLSSDGDQSSPKTSMFSLPRNTRPEGKPSHDTAQSQRQASSTASLAQGGLQPAPGSELIPEIVEGIEELLDELRQVDDQIAAYAVEQIHSRELILVNSTSRCITKFLLKAAAKRKFSVMVAEAYPNGNDTIYETVTVTQTDKPKTSQHVSKTLTAAGLTVTLIPDSAVFGVMPRISKVLLDADAVLLDGSFVCTSGAKTITKAAKLHRTPVVVLSGVYKLSPQYPFSIQTLLESGNVGKVPLDLEGKYWENVELQNPLKDHVAAQLVDLYISNLGGHSPSSLYRTISDHYKIEDYDLGAEGI